MVWGLKTSENTGVSAYMTGNRKARFCGASALGLLFVLCAPGQINKTSFVSAMKTTEVKSLHAQPAKFSTTELRASSVPKIPRNPKSFLLKRGPKFKLLSNLHLSI